MAGKIREKKISAAFREKEKTVAEIQNLVSAAKSVVFMDYRGLTVAEATELRNKARETGCVYKVYKNNLMRIALNNLGVTGLDDQLVGTLSVIFSNNDEISGVKAVAGQKFKGKMALKFGIMGDSILTAEEVTALRDLPTKEELIAKLMGLLQSGARGIASVVQAVPRNLAIVVNTRASA